MGCPDPNLIAAFVGGMLDPVRAEQLDGHLDGCTACDELVAWSIRAAESSPARGEAGAVRHGRDLRPRDPEFGRYILLELIGRDRRVPSRSPGRRPRRRSARARA